MKSLSAGVTQFLHARPSGNAGCFSAWVWRQLSCPWLNAFTAFTLVGSSGVHEEELKHSLRSQLLNQEILMFVFRKEPQA